MNVNNKRPHSDLEESTHPSLPDEGVLDADRPRSRPRLDSLSHQHANDTSLRESMSFPLVQEGLEQEEEMTLEDAAKAFEDAYREAHGHGVGEGPGNLNGGGMEQREEGVEVGVGEGGPGEVPETEQVDEQHVQHGRDGAVLGETAVQTSTESQQNQSIPEESPRQEASTAYAPMETEPEQVATDGQQVDANCDVVIEVQPEIEGEGGEGEQEGERGGGQEGRQEGGQEGGQEGEQEGEQDGEQDGEQEKMDGQGRAEDQQDGIEGQESAVDGEEGQEGGEGQGVQEEEEGQGHQPDYNEQLHLLVAHLAAQQDQAHAEAEAQALAAAQGDTSGRHPPSNVAADVAALTAFAGAMGVVNTTGESSAAVARRAQAGDATLSYGSPYSEAGADVAQLPKKGRPLGSTTGSGRAAQTPRQREKTAVRNAQNTGVTQTLVLQILTSLTTISTLTGVDLNTLTATLMPTLNVPPVNAPSAATPGAPALGNPLMALLAHLQRGTEDDFEEEPAYGPDWHNLTEEEILERGSYPGETPKQRRERRSRNRMVLNVRGYFMALTIFDVLIVPSIPSVASVCAEQCDRKIPCGRCIKRGVASLCQTETPILPPTKKDKKAAESTAAMGLSIDTANKIFALEGVLRANPSLLQTLMGAGFDLGGIMDGFGSGGGQELGDQPGMGEEQMVERHDGEGDAQVQVDDAEGHQEDQTQPGDTATSFMSQQAGDEGEPPSAEQKAESQEGPEKEQSTGEEATEQPSAANDDYGADVEEPATTEGVIQPVATHEQPGQSTQAPEDGSAVPPVNSLISFPQSQPQDEEQQQQEQQEDYDTQQHAQQSQQADAAALIAQLSQSLLAQQPPQAQAPSNAVAPSSGFAPIITTGAGAAAAGTGFVDENAGQGALLMDVLQHLSGAPGKNNAANFLNNLLANSAQFTANVDLWSQVPPALPETTVQVQLAYEADEDASKLNLGLAGFREDDGKLFVPPTVRQVERKLYIQGGIFRDALPVEGFLPFLESGLRFSYGPEGIAYKEGRIAAVQTVSITGALRLGGTFLSRHPSHPPLKAIYIPNPTTEEDAWALKDAGLEIRLYRFFDRKTGGIDWEGMREDLQGAPAKSLILLHVSGTTPTGVELTLAQWRMLTEIIKAGQLTPFLVMEYQGLSSGDHEKDAQPLRFMAHEGIPLVLAQSFDASMGLYADSPTIVSVIASTVGDKERIESQLKSMARAMYAHPPPWGAYVAAGILGDSVVHSAWLIEVKAMSERLKSIREKLYDQLTNKLKTPGNWSHFRKCQGMYSTVLLNPHQLQLLASTQHVHLLPDGCFSLGCLNAVKIETLAAAIDKVVRMGDVANGSSS